MAKKFTDLISDVLPSIKEVYPWDLEEMLEETPNVVLVDIREAEEFDAGHIKGSILAPRGILEACCDWNYSDTIPELVKARQQPVVVICRSGNRSVLAAFTMQLMGYEDIYSLKTGIKGWNDSETELLNKQGDVVDVDWAEAFLSPPVEEYQLAP